MLSLCMSRGILKGGPTLSQEEVSTTVALDYSGGIL